MPYTQRQQLARGKILKRQQENYPQIEVKFRTALISIVKGQKCSPEMTGKIKSQKKVRKIA